MKKYTFRLEPVLKLRKLKEENCRIELGQLVQHLSQIEEQMIQDRADIQTYFQIQEKSLFDGMLGKQIQAISMLIQAKEKNIELLGREKLNYQNMIDSKRSELAQLKGEVKVMENLKEKDFQKFRYALNKELDQKLEEQTQNWLEHNKK